MSAGGSLVTFQVGEHVGWVDIEFRVGGNSFAMAASYLSDPLGDLVRIALLAVTGADEGAIVIDCEGPLWRVEFATITAPTRGNSGLLQLTVRNVSDTHAPDEEKVFRADIVTVDFAADILREAASVRAAHVACWQREACPPVSILALQAALDFLA